MKKYLTLPLIALSILALLFSALPAGTALAMKEKANITIKVKNRTNSDVILWLYDDNGGLTEINYAPGVTATVMPEGRYTYIASTRCGSKSGFMNLNVTKQLDFACSHGASVALHAAGRNYCFDVWDFSRQPGYTYNIWTNYGPHCQDKPAYNGDWIRVQVDPGHFDWVEFYDAAPKSCLGDRGPAFYTRDCPKY